MTINRQAARLVQANECNSTWSDSVFCIWMVFLPRLRLIWLKWLKGISLCLEVWEILCFKGTYLHCVWFSRRRSCELVKLPSMYMPVGGDDVGTTTQLLLSRVQGLLGWVNNFKRAIVSQGTQLLWGWVRIVFVYLNKRLHKHLILPIRYSFNRHFVLVLSGVMHAW